MSQAVVSSPPEPKQPAEHDSPKAKMTTPADPSILNRISAGDQSAVDECLDHYGRLIWSLAQRYLPSQAEAEDAVQEVFVELWQSAHRFDPTRGTEVTFVAMIARRRLIDYARRLSSAPALAALDEEWAESGEEQVCGIDLEEDAAQAQRCLQKLSLPERSVIEMSVIKGFAHGKISRLLKVALGTVKSRARRGLMKIRDCMKASASATLGGSQ